MQSCDIEERSIIGYGSTICAGARIQKESIIGPNSVVPPGRMIPTHQLWAGNPVTYVRDLTKAEIVDMTSRLDNSLYAATNHRSEYLPYNTAYLQKDSQEEEEITVDMVKPDYKHEIDRQFYPRSL